ARRAHHYLPNRIVGLHDPAAGTPDLPLLAGKTAVGGRAALFVCRNIACQRPVTEASGGAAALEAGLPSATDTPRGGLAPAILGGAASAEATSAFAQRSPFA